MPLRVMNSSGDRVLGWEREAEDPTPRPQPKPPDAPTRRRTNNPGPQQLRGQTAQSCSELLGRPWMGSPEASPAQRYLKLLKISGIYLNCSQLLEGERSCSELLGDLGGSATAPWGRKGPMVLLTGGATVFVWIIPCNCN